MVGPSPAKGLFRPWLVVNRIFSERLLTSTESDLSTGRSDPMKLLRPIGFMKPIVSLIAITVVAGCSTRPPYVRGGDDGTAISIDPQLVKQRIVLIGDAGEPTSCGSAKDTCVLDSIVNTVTDDVADKTVVIFLGDNVYDKGISHPLEKHDGTPATPAAAGSNPDTPQDRLNAQYDLLTKSPNGTKGIFVPGNHDWGGGSGPSREAWDRQLESLRAIDKDANRLLGLDELTSMKPGCPGLAKIDLNGVRVVILDTQWWLSHDEELRTHDCSKNDNADPNKPDEVSGWVFPDLDDLIQNAEDEYGNKLEIVLATHHPLTTHGPHGGYMCSWPVIGAVVNAGRKMLGHNQDLFGDRNKAMQGMIRKALDSSGQRPLIHAAGHDHSLQVMDYSAEGGAAQFNLISGAGSKSKLSAVTYGSDTLYSDNRHTGFMIVDYMEDGAVYLRVMKSYDANADKVKAPGILIYAKKLKSGDS